MEVHCRLQLLQMSFDVNYLRCFVATWTDRSIHIGNNHLDCGIRFDFDWLCGCYDSSWVSFKCLSDFWLPFSSRLEVQKIVERYHYVVFRAPTHYTERSHIQPIFETSFFLYLSTTLSFLCSEESTSINKLKKCDVTGSMIYHVNPAA